MQLDDLRRLLAEPNIAAFLRVIRETESSNDPAGYGMRWPGKTFTDFAQHPRIFEPTSNGLRSSAAGAYQITATTWDDLRRTYPFQDFTPETQDLACVALLDRRHAITPLLAGDFDTAVMLCRQEWTSLPNATESHSRWTLEKARAVWQAYGGSPASGAPAETPPPVVPPQVPAGPAPSNPSSGRPFNPDQDSPMFPLAIAIPILQSIASAIPALGPLFGSGEVAQRNQKLGGAVLDAAIAATNAVNAQDAAEKIAVDPAAQAAAQAAILALPEVSVLLESGGGGIQGARQAAFNADQLPIFKNGAFWIALLAISMAAFVVVWVMTHTFSENIQTQVITGAMGFAGVAFAFWLGSSMGSQRKDLLK